MIYILFILGFIFLIRGAEWLIEGASSIARKFGIPDLITGMTVVAFGTSLPELIVNLFANGESSDLAIGNIVGSNIANVFLVLGVAAIIRPLTVRRKMIFREIIFNVVAASAVGLLISDKLLGLGSSEAGLDRIDGTILIVGFVAFLYYTFSKIHKGGKDLSIGADEDLGKFDIPNTIMEILGGIAGLYFGGKWIVDGAIEVATLIGASDAFIGLTVVAIGTSLPELAASVIAVRNKNVDIAVGNAVGSNLFNLLWVLGLSAFISPLRFEGSVNLNVYIMIASAVILFGTMFVGKVKHQIGKNEGIAFLVLYLSYIVYTIISY